MSKNSTRMPMTGCGYAKGGKVKVPVQSKMGMALKNKKKK